MGFLSVWISRYRQIIQYDYYNNTSNIYENDRIITTIINIVSYLK